MKRIFFIALLLVSSVYAGDSTEIDASLNDIEELLQKSPDVALGKLDVLLKEQSLTREQKARVEVFRAINHMVQGDYASASTLLEGALTHTSDIKRRVKILGYLATAKLLLKQYADSLAFIGDMLAQIEAIDDRDIQRYAYIRLSSIYYQMGLFEQVGIYAQKALALSTESNGMDNCHSYLYIAASLMEAGHFRKAVDAFENTRSYCSKNNLPLIVAMANKGKGWSFLRDKQTEPAISYLQQALADYQKFGYELEIASTQSLLAKAFMAADNWKDAEASAVAAIDKAAAEDRALRDAWEVLAAVYAQKGDFKAAFQAQEKEVEHADRIVDETKAREIAYQAAKFNFEEQRREISLLNSERDGYLVRQEAISREHSGSLMASTVLLGVCLFLSLFLAAGLAQRNRFRRLAQRDGLTGVYNRATGQDKGENALVRCMARKEPVALILLDLDFFKRINDEYGHATGDWALKKVVEVIRPELKIEHIFSRIGGEEFMIVLPDCTGIMAAEIAESCRQVIAEVDTHYSGHRFTLNASFGVTSLTELDLSLDPLLCRADESLYCAKRLGRNTVVLDGEPYSPVVIGNAPRKRGNKAAVVALDEIPSQVKKNGT